MLNKVGCGKNFSILHPFSPTPIFCMLLCFDGLGGLDGWDVVWMGLIGWIGWKVGWDVWEGLGGWD